MHVDGRGQAGVQNLVGDIGRFEEEHHIGKLLVQPLAQAFGGDLGGSVVLSQRNQNVAVVAPDGRAVSEGQIEAARGNADIVENRIQLPLRNDAANLLLDFGE